MRATGIRYLTDAKGKPTPRLLEDLCQYIVAATAREGYVTEAHVLNGCSIKIGLHMSSFRVDTATQGHNARIGRHIDSPKGYKRTDVPTWEQRVEFNDIVNDAFDTWGYAANIKSGCFTVRDKLKGRHSEGDWLDQTPSHMGYKGAICNGFGDEIARIVNEKDAREDLDSDRLEAEHAQATRADRLAKAQARRRLWKELKEAAHVRVSLVSPWRAPKKLHKYDGLELTQRRFQTFWSLLCELEPQAKRAFKFSVGVGF